MEEALFYAVMDEAGDTGYTRGASNYLIVAAIVCDSIVPLRKIVERTRDTLTKRMKRVSELKASQIPDNIVLRMLHQLADAVAWSILQKYTYEDIRFYHAIEKRIKEETVVVK